MDDEQSVRQEKPAPTDQVTRLSGAATSDIPAATDLDHIADINARIDRLPAWGLSRWVFFAIGIAYFSMYFDIAVIGVALPSLLPSLHLPESASAPPITANLIAYIIGSYTLGSLSDYIGRRRAFIICIACLAAGALLTALSWNLTSLMAFRALTGFGTGGQVAIVAAFVGELSNASNRGRFLSLCTAWGAAGFVAAPFLAIALSQSPDLGWRVLFGTGIVIVATLIFCRDRWLPESPRWLVLHGHHDRAERIVRMMELTAMKRRGGTTALPAAAPVRPEARAQGFPTRQLLSREYLPKIGLVIGFWLTFFLWLYGFLGYEPTLLAKAGGSNEATLLYTGLGYLGFLAGALVAPFVIDRIERKVLIAGSIGVSIVGLVLFATSTAPLVIVVGGIVVGFGDMLGNAAAFAYTSEIFPTRARTSATSLGDGLGHVGAAIGPFIVVAILTTAHPQAVFWMFAGIALVSALLILMGVRTSRVGLTDLAQ
jgi:putative MFS transporter